MTGTLGIRNQQRAFFRTPAGNPALFTVRPDTSDWNTCNAITVVGDEYHMPRGLTGWGLDVGAHIGAATVTFLLDNPDARMVAIEALPENVELLRHNLELNGVADRCIVLSGAAGNFKDSEARIGYGEVTDPTRIHEYIGNANAPEGSREVICPVVALPDVLNAIEDRELGPMNENALTVKPSIAWAKFDCEGCEYGFLDALETFRIEHIEGEVHHGWQRLVDILSPTHEVTGPGKDFGPFTAVRRP